MIAKIYYKHPTLGLNRIIIFWSTQGSKRINILSNLSTGQLLPCVAHAPLCEFWIWPTSWNIGKHKRRFLLYMNDITRGQEGNLALVPLSEYLINLFFAWLPNYVSIHGFPAKLPKNLYIVFLAITIIK